jgi:hypothetical protein
VAAFFVFINQNIKKILKRLAPKGLFLLNKHTFIKTLLTEHLCFSDKIHNFDIALTKHKHVEYENKIYIIAIIARLDNA